MDETIMIRTLFASLSLILLSAPAAGADRPNIVFILADDLGARDLSNEGSAYYESPNIDALARAGVKFERAYAACQVCSPRPANSMTAARTRNIARTKGQN